MGFCTYISHTYVIHFRKIEYLLELQHESINRLDSNWACSNCRTENLSADRLCAQCARPRFTLASEFGKKSVYSVMSLYFLLLVAIIFIWFVEPGGIGWKGQLYASLILAGITTVFLFFEPKDFLKYVLPQKISLKILLMILWLTPIFSFLVTNASHWANRFLFGISVNEFIPYQDTTYPLLLAIIFNAIFPSVFEEVAFRGVVFSRGRGVFSLKQMIWVSSILFTFLHLSFLSFIWIFPFALMLGWLRARYRTIFYGIVVHFLHNFTAILLAYFHWNSFW